IALDSIRLALVQVEFSHGEPEQYVLPLALEAGEKPASPQAVIAVLRRGDGSQAYLVDALFDASSATALLDAIRTGTRSRGAAGPCFREELRRYFERGLATTHDLKPPPRPPGSMVDLAEGEVPPAAREMLGSSLAAARLLGKRTAELHAALLSPDDVAFSPEP